jgi:hypothetical protein
MKKTLFLSIILTSGITSFTIFSCTNYNSVADSHFTSDGNYLVANDSNMFVLESPSRIKFFVEVSGSMNGFFRANVPTDFKTDVWTVASYFSGLIHTVDILTNDGSVGKQIPLQQFQTAMNTGSFVSSASTKTPIMLKSMIKSLEADAGEVAVLVSDMKYSPVGSAAPDVLLSQYSTDVCSIFRQYGKAICVIAATSDYRDNRGKVVTPQSPYYYVIIGNDRHVAFMRNAISILINNSKHFVDNIESGFNYGQPHYEFGVPLNCYQQGNEPTFIGYDTDANDTATIRLKLDIANYRWLMADEEYLRETLKIRALYGSKVELGNIQFDVKNTIGKELKRTAVATINLKVYGMLANDADVIEWTLELPDSDTSRFTPFFGAISENDVTKSYSIDDFLKGIFYDGVINKSIKPNYILISKQQ